MKFKIASICFVLILCLPSFVRAEEDDQPTVTTTKIEGNIPSKGAIIVNYNLDTPDPNDAVPTGNLTIVYSDGTKVVEKVPPAQKSSENETIFNEVGFNGIKISGDKRSIGWTELFENGGTSYPVPEVLAVYTSGKTIVEIQQGQMLWDWTFLDGAKHVAAVWGPTHGTSTGDYQLYDAKTGKMISEFIKDTDDKSQKPGTPEWVQQVDQKIFSHDLDPERKRRDADSPPHSGH